MSSVAMDKEDAMLQVWLNKVTSTSVKVWVENPEIVKESGFMGTTYTTFRVLLKASDGELVGVRHRFSEFEQLRNALKVYQPIIIKRSFFC